MAHYSISIRDVQYRLFHSHSKYPLIICPLERQTCSNGRFKRHLLVDGEARARYKEPDFRENLTERGVDENQELGSGTMCRDDMELCRHGMDADGVRTDEVERWRAGIGSRVSEWAEVLV